MTTPELSLIWISSRSGLPGPDTTSFVADNGNRWGIVFPLIRFFAALRIDQT